MVSHWKIFIHYLLHNINVDENIVGPYSIFIYYSLHNVNVN
jgi:hypothetical protein